MPGLKTPLLLVGHSLGSNIVRRYADRYPADVSAMVLIDPPAQNIDEVRSGLAEGRRHPLPATVCLHPPMRAAAEKHALPSTSPGLRDCLDGLRSTRRRKLNAVNLAHQSKPLFWSTLLSELQDNATVFKQPVPAREPTVRLP